MAYYTLATKEPDGRWYPQFGDHDKEAVEFERDDMTGRPRGSHGYVAKRDTKIIKTRTVRKADVDAAIAALNGGA